MVAGYSPSLTILNDLSLDARRGEITLLIGPNGAGKSTVLKTLFGLLVPRSGRDPLRGQDDRRPLASARCWPRASRSCRRGATCSARCRCCTTSSSAASRCRAASLPARIEEILQRFPAHPRAHRQPGLDAVRRRAEAARGRPRAAAASARAADRRAVDRAVAEARAGGDGAAAQAARDDGTTILMVEQNVRTALKYADRALVLETGRLALDRPAVRVARRPGPQSPVPRRRRGACRGRNAVGIDAKAPHAGEDRRCTRKEVRRRARGGCRANRAVRPAVHCGSIAIFNGQVCIHCMDNRA